MKKCCWSACKHIYWKENKNVSLAAKAFENIFLARKTLKYLTESYVSSEDSSESLDWLINTDVGCLELPVYLCNCQTRGRKAITSFWRSHHVGQAANDYYKMSNLVDISLSQVVSLYLIFCLSNKLASYIKCRYIWFFVYRTNSGNVLSLSLSLYSLCLFISLSLFLYKYILRFKFFIHINNIRFTFIHLEILTLKNFFLSFLILLLCAIYLSIYLSISKSFSVHINLI